MVEFSGAQKPIAKEENCSADYHRGLVGDIKNRIENKWKKYCNEHLNTYRYIYIYIYLSVTYLLLATLDCHNSGTRN